jgi:GNAT superfamily N-acetyltransferase
MEPSAAARVHVRAAAPADVPVIHALILALASHHGGAEHVTGTPEMLAEALFGDDPSAEALLAELGGEVVGVAVFHRCFSTWECLPGIWLEDLYVSEHARGSGAGRALLAALAGLAVQRGYARVEWHAADWNQPALGLYAAIGADVLPEQRLHRLSGAPLRRLAGGP